MKKLFKWVEENPKTCRIIILVLIIITIVFKLATYLLRLSKGVI